MWALFFHGTVTCPILWWSHHECILLRRIILDYTIWNWPELPNDAENKTQSIIQLLIGVSGSNHLSHYLTKPLSLSTCLFYWNSGVSLSFAWAHRQTLFYWAKRGKQTSTERCQCLVNSLMFKIVIILFWRRNEFLKVCS